MEQSQRMGQERIGKLLMEFSIPAIIGMIVVALYNIVDRIFVGQIVGSLAIAGITVSFPFMIIMMAFFTLTGLGATALISLKLGEGRKEEAERVIANTVLSLIVICLLLSTLGLLYLEPMLTAFGASADVLPLAADYIRIILWGSAFMGISFTLQNTVRAEGSPRFAMSTQIIGALSNIFLDYVFISLMGAGVKGAAIGTIMAQGISSAILLYHYFSGKSLVKIRIQYMMPNLRVILMIFSLGFPQFALHLVNCLQQVILLRSLGHYGGDIAIAVIGVMFSVLQIIIMPVLGISQGSQPLIGYNYGAKQYARVKRTFKAAAGAATIVAIAGFLVIQMWPEYLLSLFSKDDPALVNMGAHAIKTFFVCLPVIGFHIIGSNYFQAVGKPIQATILNLSRQFLLFIPALLILPRYMGLEGIWWTAPVADFGSVILVGILIIFEMKNLEKKSQKQTATPQLSVDVETAYQK